MRFSNLTKEQKDRLLFRAMIYLDDIESETEKAAKGIEIFGREYPDLADAFYNISSFERGLQKFTKSVMEAQTRLKELLASIKKAEK